MSELALRLIAENKKTCHPFLDLGNCGLTEVPAEIGELEWLEELSFTIVFLGGMDGEFRKTKNDGPANNIKRLISKYKYFLFSEQAETNPFSRLQNLKKLWLSSGHIEKFDLEDLAPLAVLKRLQQLDVSDSRVFDLSPLAELTNLHSLDVSRTQVTDLSPLAELMNLQSLDVGDTRVTDLSPLSELTNLRSLDVSGTRITDLSPLSELTNLQSLKVEGTRVTDLSPLTGLKKLETLMAFYTQIADVSPLAGLTNLLFVGIAKTQVSDISTLLSMIEQGIAVKWDKDNWSEGIHIEDCPLTNPPAEIVKQGNEAIINYFREKQTQGVDHLYEAKLLIVGEGRAGKTSLLRRLYYPDRDLPEENETTRGIDIYRHEFKLSNGRPFRLNVWDFGGQEIYHATHQFFLTKRSLYVLLDDTCKDYKTVQDEGFKYWLEVVDMLSEHSPVLIFQNEKGGRSKNIDFAGIKGRFDNVKECYGGNLENLSAVDKIRKAIEFYARQLPHIGEELPAKWINIRADIENRAKQDAYISQQDYFAIYENHLSVGRSKALHLSRYLHDLGVFLHFQEDDRLKHTVILQNTWATEAVFKVLDDEIVKAKLGRFDMTDCARIWQASQYADAHRELLALMQKFELCYLLPDGLSETWMVPQLLPPSKPSELSTWNQAGDLVLIYRYDFLPKGMISRLMVRLNRYVRQPKLGWINGVMFEQDYAQLLAEVSPKGGEIVLRARGLEAKTLLNIVSADLDALNDSFHGLRDKVSKWVPCHCERCVEQVDPEFYEQKRLLQRKWDGKLTIECPASYLDVDVLALLDGVHVDIMPGEVLPISSARRLPRKLFISYSKYDKQHKDTLLKHLAGLRNKIAPWSDADLKPGEEWDERIKSELMQADLVLYLVTHNSMSTDYIQNVELPLIEQRCRDKQCVLVPVIVDFCLWTALDFAKYNAMPGKGVPVADRSQWVNENEAWLNVVEGVRRFVDDSLN